MAKWLSGIILVFGMFFMAAPISAQLSGLTIPGTIPTLSPLGAPVNSLTFPGVSSPTVVPTAAPARTPAKAGFSPGAFITVYLGHTGKTAGDFINNLKLDGVTKAILMQVLAKAIAFLQAYNARIDPLMREWLTAAAARLPVGIQGFTKVFIPFLAMAGKVILGVIAGVLALRLLGFFLKSLFSSIFGKKRRRR